MRMAQADAHLLLQDLGRLTPARHCKAMEGFSWGKKTFCIKSPFAYVFEEFVSHREKKIKKKSLM